MSPSSLSRLPLRARPTTTTVQAASADTIVPRIRSRSARGVVDLCRIEAREFHEWMNATSPSSLSRVPPRARPTTKTVQAASASLSRHHCATRTLAKRAWGRGLVSHRGSRVPKRMTVTPPSSLSRAPPRAHPNTTRFRQPQPTPLRHANAREKARGVVDLCRIEARECQKDHHHATLEPFSCPPPQVFCATATTIRTTPVDVVGAARTLAKCASQERSPRIQRNSNNLKFFLLLFTFFFIHVLLG